MSRLTLFARLFAGVALGAGAIGYAATGGREFPEPAAKSTSVPSKVVEPGIPGPARPADRQIEVTPAQGLTKALLKAGVAGLDAALAEQAAGSATGRLWVWLGSAIGPTARSLDRLQLRTGPDSQIVLIRAGDGFVRLRLTGEEIAAGLVEAGLPRALRNRILDEVAGQEVALLDLIVEHASAGEGDADYGSPLYLGLHGADGRVVRWVGGSGQLRRLGQGTATAGLLRPLPGPVTSSPGLRFHPILRYLRWHRGTDFAAAHGAPVQAADAGRVIEAGWKGGYGQTVRIGHADGSVTVYAHLSQVDVAPGEIVAQGEVLGRVGSTGLATGPHLHFEWRRGGKALVPTFAAAASGAIRSADRAAVQAMLSAPFRLPPRRPS